MKFQELVHNKKILLAGLIVLVVLGFIGFLIYRQQVFSKEIVRLEIIGPQQAVMGEEIQYIVKYKNNGNFTLEKPRLEFELPAHSLTEDGKLSTRTDLADIYPGQEHIITFKARIFGKEGDIKTAKARLSYIPHNLSARYESHTTLTTVINSVPIALTYTMLSAAAAGTEFSYSLHYASALDYPLENMSLRIEPREGFLITAAQPSSLDNREWKLPTLTKSKEGKIHITGTIETTAPRTLDFVAQLGMWQNGTFIVVKQVQSSLVIDERAPSSSAQPLTKIKIRQQGFYANQTGLENSGPIPPRVGQATTYTVRWSVENDTRTLNAVTVRATLPPNVAIGDNIFPEEEVSRFSFDIQSRQAVWSLGTLTPRATITLLFQVTITPDELQKGTLAKLISAVEATAHDAAGGATIQSYAPAIDTSLPDDATNSGGGVVGGL